MNAHLKNQKLILLAIVVVAFFFQNACRAKLETRTKSGGPMPAQTSPDISPEPETPVLETRTSRIIREITYAGN